MGKEPEIINGTVRLLKLERDSDKDYQQIVQDFESKGTEVKRLEVRIEALRAEEEKAQMALKEMNQVLTERRKAVDTEKRRLDQELEQEIRQQRLALENVQLVVNILPEELRKQNLKERDVEKIKAQIIELGGLYRVTSQVEREKRSLDQHLPRLRQECKQLEFERAKFQRSIGQLRSSMRTRQLELQRLRLERDKMRTDVDMVKRWLAFIGDPKGLQGYQVDRLYRDMFDLNMRRQGFYLLRDQWGTITWQTALPVSMPTDKIAEEIRVRMVELLMPLVKDKFVPKWECDKLEREVRRLNTIIEVKLQQLETKVKELKPATATPLA